MDLSGLVLTALAVSFELASELYSYGKHVKGARRDIQSLSNELFGLVGVLEHLKLQQDQGHLDDLESTGPPEYSEVQEGWDTNQLKDDVSAQDAQNTNVRSILRQTLEFLEELQKALIEPKGRFQSAVHLLKWPLKEGEMKKHLKRLERVKTYFVLSLVTAEGFVISLTVNGVHE